MGATETTAIQRLGHVFGWTGNVIAALLMAGALAVVGYQCWEYANPEAQSGYEFGPWEDGKTYMAVGGGSSNDAEKAI